MKKFYITVFSALLVVMQVCAHDFTVISAQGVEVYYDRYGSYATVTYKGNSWDEYSDEYANTIPVIIPTQVLYTVGTYLTVNAIDSYAFAGCPGVKWINISESVTSVGSYAFYGCSGLLRINVAETNPSFYSDEGVLMDKNRTMLYAYPNAKGSSYTVPSGVTNILCNAFAGCRDLTTVVLPESVSAFGSEVFKESGLARLEVGWQSPVAVGSDVFDGVNLSAVTLVVPAGTRSLYESADVWQGFGTIEESSSSAIVAPVVAARPVAYYNLQGQQLQGVPDRGIYIVKYDDGTAKKRISVNN